MKKILYGIIVLLGIGFISTNFIVDTNNVDHKTVKAGGTACRWVSESGYGVGPHYVKSTTCNSSGTCDSSDTNILDNFIDLLPCSVSNSDDTKDGKKLYNSDNSLFTGYIRFSNHVFSSATHSIFLKVTNGVISNVKSYTNRSIYKYDYSSDTLVNISNPNFFAYYNISLGPVLNNHNYSDTYNEYPTDINGDGEWTFTCVCAEY